MSDDDRVLIPEYDVMDAAIRAYVLSRSTIDGRPKLCTGWTAIFATIDVADSDGGTFFNNANSEGLAFHARLGLLVNAQHDMLNPGDE